MASPTMPIKGGADDFLVWLNRNCGLKRHSNNTTCTRVYKYVTLICAFYNVVLNINLFYFIFKQILYIKSAVKNAARIIGLPGNPTT